MRRLFPALFLVLLMFGPALGGADDQKSSNWKFVIRVPNAKKAAPWLLKLDSKGGNWTGTVLDAEEDLPRGTIEEITVEEGLLRFHFRISPAIVFKFEGRLPGEKESRILGSITLKGAVQPASLEPTVLSSFDLFEVNKETLTLPVTTQEVVQAAMQLLEMASEKKAKPEEVSAWAERAAHAAQQHGPSWHREIILDIAAILSHQEAYASTALSYARQAEQLMTDTDSTVVKKKILSTLAAALENAGKIDEARSVHARNNQISYITVTKYPGRQSKSTRAVLVEMFTCAQSPHCVASELTFDALQETYKPTEVVLLQYHLHLPGPDPLTNLDAVERQKQYRFEAIPSTYFNGQALAKGGGLADIAQPNYERFRKVIDPMLEKPAQAAIKLEASQRGSKIDIQADVTDLEATGESVRLYLVLAEEVVAYTGGNKLRTHSLIVRAFPGGAEGTIVGKKEFTKKVTLDLETVRQKLTDYLDKYGRDNPFPSKERPMEMKKLRLVAFIQNEDTKEVYQAAQTTVTPE